MPIGKLHTKAVNMVSAVSQAKAYEKLFDILNDTERDILRRGRNAATRAPKSCSVEDYHKATAIETLFGYLYLLEEYTRLNEIFSLMENLIVFSESASNV